MKIYRIQDDAHDNEKKVSTALRQAFGGLVQGLATEWISPHAYDGEKNFFLQTADEVFWGRFFDEPLSRDCLDELLREGDGWVRMFKRKMEIYVFFPFLKHGVLDCLRTPGKLHPVFLLGAPMHFFEYCFLESGEEEGIALRELVLCRKPVLNKTSDPMAPTKDHPPRKSLRIEKHPPGHAVSADSGYHFFKLARLSRPELVELTDLALEMTQI